MKASVIVAEGFIDSQRRSNVASEWGPDGLWKPSAQPISTLCQRSLGRLQPIDSASKTLVVDVNMTWRSRGDASLDIESAEHKALLRQVDEAD